MKTILIAGKLQGTKININKSNSKSQITATDHNSGQNLNNSNDLKLLDGSKTKVDFSIRSI